MDLQDRLLLSHFTIAPHSAGTVVVGPVDIRTAAIPSLFQHPRRELGASTCELLEELSPSRLIVRATYPTDAQNLLDRAEAARVRLSKNREFESRGWWESPWHDAEIHFDEPTPSTSFGVVERDLRGRLWVWKVQRNAQGMGRLTAEPMPAATLDPNDPRYFHTIDEWRRLSIPRRDHFVELRLCRARISC